MPQILTYSNHAYFAGEFSSRPQKAAEITEKSEIRKNLKIPGEVLAKLLAPLA